MLKQFIKNSFSKTGYRISKILPSPVLELWDTDNEFLRCVSRSEGRSVVSAQKMYLLYGLAKNVKRGSIAEVGVYRGGTAMLLASILPDFTIHAFDTFECMPDTTEHDTHKAGDFVVDTQEVLTFLGAKKNIAIHKGVFPATAKEIPPGEEFGLVHIDVDIYQSVQDCLEYFYSRTVSGGFIVSDDYGAKTCPGAFKAWNEFFSGKPESTIYLPTGQCFVVKS